MPAASCTLANILTQGEPGDPAFPVKVNGFSRAATLARSFQVGAEFADINGASLGQQFGGPGANGTPPHTPAPPPPPPPPPRAEAGPSPAREPATAPRGAAARPARNMPR